MFNLRKSNKQTLQSPEIIEQINKDLLVRNMPNANKLVGTGSPISMTSSLEKNIISPAGAEKNNKHQTVGLVIVIGGFILIGVLVYLSYVFIIKNQLQPAKESVKEVNKVLVNVDGGNAATSSQDIINPIVDASLLIPSTTVEVASSTLLEDVTEDTNQTEEALAPILDMDGDGLNNEEELILGTSIEFRDSNSNNYPDLVEINNGYNPSGAGHLNSNSGLKKYTNEKLSYSLLFPSSWENSSLNDDSVVIFNTPDDSIIQISVQENSEKQSILNWYSALFPQAMLTYDRLISTDSWTGVFGEDFLNFYLTDKDKNNIYTISYIPAVSGRVVYPNIFKLMINSISIK